MAQQNIDFGDFPNDPHADPIREAFQKIQNNFTELYATQFSSGVVEVVAGQGLAQNRTYGNISLTANISNIRLSTGSTRSLVFGTTTSPTGGNVTTTSSQIPIYIDLAPTITTGNANFTATTTTANLRVTGLVKTGLMPEGDELLDLGSPTHRWRDLYLSGNSLNLGQIVVNEQDGALVAPNILVNGNIDAGAISAGTVEGNLTTAVQPNITGVGTLEQLQVATTITANAITAGTFSGNVILPAGANLQAPGANMQVVFNDSGNAAAVPGMTYDKANTLLTVQGNIVSSNISTTLLNVDSDANITGNIGVNGVVASDVTSNTITTLGALVSQATITSGKDLEITNMYVDDGGFNVVEFASQDTIPFNVNGDIVLSGVSPTTYNRTWQVVDSGLNYIKFSSLLRQTPSFAGARIKGSGNTTINGVLEVYGNTSMGNITAVDSITGNLITVQGNVDSGNLISQGFLQVTGTANVGAVYSDGDSNVANSLVRGNFGAKGSALFGGTVRANGDASFYGNLLANANLNINGFFKAGEANIANLKITSGGNISGNIFIATLFQGNGANISFINGSNVTGIVANAANANLATFAGTADITKDIKQGAYSNITGVGTLTSLTVNADFSSGDASINGYLKMSVNNAVAANGQSQVTATALTKTINVVTGTNGNPPGTGVKLPPAAPGTVIYIINETPSSMAIKVYPADGQYIDKMAQNSPLTIGTGGRMTFIGTSSTQFYSMTSIYA